jgi:hypothetical protein
MIGSLNDVALISHPRYECFAAQTEVPKPYVIISAISIAVHTNDAKFER